MGHEITLYWAGIATYFEGVETLVRVHLAPGGTEAVSSQFLDLWQNVAFKAHVQPAMILVDVILKFSIAQLVARFKFTVILGLLLYGIIGEVNHAIGKVVEGELAAGCAQVALCVVVRLEVAVVARHHAVGADVELAPVDQQRVVDIFLNDASLSR